MPILTWSVKGTDSIFQTSQPDLFKYDPNDKELKLGHVSEVTMPNLTSSPKYPLVCNDSANTPKTYVTNASGSWAEIDPSTNKFQKDSLEGMWIVVIPAAQPNYVSVYLCKDLAEKLTIPNYELTAGIEFKVVSSITTVNFNATSSAWRYWFQTDQSWSDKYLPLAPVAIKNDDSMLSMVVASYDSNTSKINVKTVAFFKSQSHSDADQGSPITLSVNTKIGNQAIQTLEERVVLLEQRVDELSTAISDMRSIITTLDKKIMDIGSSTSKFFVSR